MKKYPKIKRPPGMSTDYPGKPGYSKAVDMVFRGLEEFKTKKLPPELKALCRKSS